MSKNKNIKFDIYGINNTEPIWGDNFYIIFLIHRWV